ncbi:hypothetical protein D3C86_2153280 [compost metagenome]
MRQKEKELKELVLKQNKTPIIKFTYCFESLTTNFNDLLLSLQEIKEANPEEYEEYKQAVIKLMAQMSEHI